MQVLILNAGSSSLKYSLMDTEREGTLQAGTVDVAAPTDYAGAVTRVVSQIPRADLAAVGHRVVHGGDKYTSAVRITPEVIADLARLADVAPLHNPPSVEVIRRATEALPGVPQVAAFDTAFHATLPPAARVYPVPHAWYRDWGLRRYGFHGLSHAYCAARAAEMLRRPAAGLRLVICHLGHGCSASAVRDGHCVDTTMGFTPLEGLMMGTRSGSVDPGLLLHVLRHRGLTPEQLDHVLNYESGLLGLSGISADMRRVQEAARGGHEAARLALDVYAHRIRQTVGAMTATLGGLDALVFTAGVGENAADLRAAVCQGLDHLGIQLDPEANARCHPDQDVARPESRARVLVVRTREDVMILREAAALLAG